MATSKTVNRLDQVTKLLRDQLHDIEKEQRELQRAKDRVLKALGLFVQDTPQGPSYKRRGPINRHSHTVVMNAIKATYVPGHVFHRRNIYELNMSEPLRYHQMAGAVDTLYKMGVLKRAGKQGYYYYGTEAPNGE